MGRFQPTTAPLPRGTGTITLSSTPGCARNALAAWAGLPR